MKTVLATLALPKQLIQFFGLACGISWLLWSPYYLPLGVSVKVLLYVHFLGSLGPMLAAMTLLYREKGMDGIRQLLGRAIPKRTFVYWLFIAFLAPIALLVLLVIFTCIRQFAPLHWDTLVLSDEFSFLSPVAYVAGTLFFFGLGEEAGWRGFVLPRLQANRSAFTANLLLTFFWAVWHWPLFLNPLGGYMHMNAGAVIGWFFSLLTGGILFTWLFNSSGGNVLACAVFHRMMDVVFKIDLNVPQLNTYTGVLVTLWGLYVWLVYKPANLSLAHKTTVQPLEAHR
ncbi:CPBP family intramembrane glutamic endopeptidase [Spirosoma aerophilum]